MTQTRLPRPLLLAAALAVLQGVVLIGYGVLELAATSGSRPEVGLTTGIFFAGYGAGLVACGWGLSRLVVWARSPIVLAQLLHLGVAWSFRGGGTSQVAWVLAAVSVTMLVLILWPSTLAALRDSEDESAG
ncbi:hypothetical protein [Nocardioides limicola]|uniref:hypothetical protein n=1 Tax=Nocardioides limicola TaxID=2803368 RepID=UPI00193AFE26|nr:hypothetical protein [Nocardioides sp. DJM-14]